MRQVVLHSISTEMDLKKKTKVRHLPVFLERMSTLLQEGYTFFDSLMMLIPYHVKEVDEWKRQLIQLFINGSSVVEILRNFPIPKHYLVMIQIAEEKGDLAETLKHVAKELEFHERLRKNLLKLLSYPLFLMIVLTGIFIVFRTQFFPNIQQIANASLSKESSSFLLSKLFLHLPDALLIFAIMMVGGVILFLFYIRKQETNRQVHILLHMPVVNYFYRMTITKQFARLIGSLLVAGFSMQQALEILEQQEINKQLSYITSLVKNRVIYGESLSDVVKILEIFTPKFEIFIRHGEESGYLGREIMLYSDLLNERMQSIIKTCISIMQPLFFMIIAICIIAAYLSILLPMYDLFEML